MPTYEITAPDGKVLEITAPEGATQEQVLAYAQQSYQAQPKQRTMEERYAAAGIDPNEYSPTDGMSTAEKFFAGFGKSIYDTGRGIGQLFGQQSEADIDEARRLDAPLMDTGAGMVGNIAGQTAQIAAPVPAGAALKATSWAGRAAPYVGAAARSGAFGASQGVGTGETRGGNAATSAAFGVGGQGVASGAKALARGTASRIDKAVAGLARGADARGIRLSVPQLSENPMVRTVGSQLERLPFSGAAKRNDANQEAFNRAVGKSFGADAPKITPDVFAAAKRKLSNEFETLTARNNLAPTAQLVGDLRNVIDEADRLAVGDTGRVVRGWVDELLSKTGANGTIPGKAYQSFDSKIGKAMKAGGETANYLGAVRESVRKAMDSSISPRDAAKWAQVRGQWANMKTVEPLVGKSPAGNIPPSQLMGRVTSDGAGKVRMASGKGGELGELARIGQQFLKDAPNSGTADRLLVNSLIGGGLYGAQGVGLVSPETAAWAGAGLLGNRLAGRVLASKGLTMGNSKPLNGLARLMSQSPRLAPAAYGAAMAPEGLEIDIEGGTPVSEEEFRRMIREGR